MEVFEALFELVNFLFDVKEIFESFFNGWVRGSEFGKDVSFLKVSGGVVKFEVVDRENVVGDEVVDKGEHVDSNKKVESEFEEEFAIVGVNRDWVVSLMVVLLLLFFRSSWIISSLSFASWYYL